MKSKITGIIPARYASTRFPGKPLALINGVPMVLKVWEKVRESLDDVYIATDNKKIFDIAHKAGAKVIMTSIGHTTGTERVAEAASKIFAGQEAADNIIINIQGDEPMISSEAIARICNAFDDDAVEIATLVHKIQDKKSIQNHNRPKVVFDRNFKALYFSRSPIPWLSSEPNTPENVSIFQHIGVYGFRFSVLQKLITLRPTPLEQAERLEQLRWLEHGYSIHCVESDYHHFSIDVPEDLDLLNNELGKS